MLASAERSSGSLLSLPKVMPAWAAAAWSFLKLTRVTQAGSPGAQKLFLAVFWAWVLSLLVGLPGASQSASTGCLPAMAAKGTGHHGVKPAAAAAGSAAPARGP